MKKIYKIANSMQLKLAQSKLDGLPKLLAFMRAASMIHQTNHWQTNGQQYYADHLLFMRLYDDSQDPIDGVGERLVGLGSADLVDGLSQVKMMNDFIALAYNQAGGTEPNDMVKRSLYCEETLLSMIKNTIDNLGDDLTHGLSNLLEDTADKHETFVYLLKQRLEKE